MMPLLLSPYPASHTTKSLLLPGAQSAPAEEIGPETGRGWVKSEESLWPDQERTHGL